MKHYCKTMVKKGHFYCEDNRKGIVEDPLDEDVPAYFVKKGRVTRDLALNYAFKNRFLRARANKGKSFGEVRSQLRRRVPERLWHLFDRGYLMRPDELTAGEVDALLTERCVWARRNGLDYTQAETQEYRHQWIPKKEKKGEKAVTKIVTSTPTVLMLLGKDGLWYEVTLVAIKDLHLHKEVTLRSVPQPGWWDWSGVEDPLRADRQPVWRTKLTPPTWEIKDWWYGEDVTVRRDASSEGFCTVSRLITSKGVTASGTEVLYDRSQYIAVRVKSASFKMLKKYVYSLKA